MEMDNEAARIFCSGNAQRTKLKHIDCRQHWVRTLRDKGIMNAHVPTGENLADLFTKILPPVTFLRLRDLLMKPYCTLSLSPVWFDHPIIREGENEYVVCTVFSARYRTRRQLRVCNAAASDCIATQDRKRVSTSNKLDHFYLLTVKVYLQNCCRIYNSQNPSSQL